MAAFNQLQIDTQNNVILYRSMLQIADDTAVFEMMQRFTHEEAQKFGEGLLSAAETVRNTIAVQEKVAALDKRKVGKKKTAKKAAKKKAAKKARRRTR